MSTRDSVSALMVFDTNLCIARRYPGRTEDRRGGYAGVPNVTDRRLEPFAFDQRSTLTPAPTTKPASDFPMRPSALRLSIGETDPRRRLASDITDAAATGQLEGYDERGVPLDMEARLQALNFDARAVDDDEQGANEISDDAGHESSRGPTTYAGAPRRAACVLAARPDVPIDELDEWGKSALHYAALRGDSELLASLLARGADAARLDGGGSSPLHLALFNRRERIATTLAQRPDVDLQRLDGSGFTPLCIAVSLGLVEATHALLRGGARVMGRNANLAACGFGQIPLHAAVRICHIKIVSMLFTVDRGRHVAQQLASVDSKGHTPLHIACSEDGSFPLVSQLLKLGADPTARDRAGKSPGDAAREAGHPALAEAIKEYAAERAAKVAVAEEDEAAAVAAASIAAIAEEDEECKSGGEDRQQREEVEVEEGKEEEGAVEVEVGESGQPNGSSSTPQRGRGRRSAAEKEGEASSSSSSSSKEGA